MSRLCLDEYIFSVLYLAFLKCLCLKCAWPPAKTVPGPRNFLSTLVPGSGSFQPDGLAPLAGVWCGATSTSLACSHFSCPYFSSRLPIGKGNGIIR